MMNEADKRAINNDYQPCGYVLRLSYDAFFPQSYHLIYLLLSSMLSAVHYLESQSLFESWLSLINWISVFCTFVMWLIWWCGSVANLMSDISRRQVLLFSFPHLSLTSHNLLIWHAYWIPFMRLGHSRLYWYNISASPILLIAAHYYFLFFVPCLFVSQLLPLLLPSFHNSGCRIPYLPHNTLLHDETRLL